MSAILKGTLKAPARIAAGTGIAQDNIIFAMLLFAFVVWITTKKELPIYLSFFKSGKTQGLPADHITASPTTGGASSPLPAGIVPSTSPNATPHDPTQGSIPSWVPGASAGNWLTNFGTFLMHPFSGTK